MAKQDEPIEFEHKGIGEVLAQNRLAVPLNQREYKWEAEHIEDLFTDFANAIAKNQSSYFLGTIVLTRGEGEIPEVSDGQQRLATTTILLATIRDYFYHIGDTIRATSIEQDFLKKTDIETTDMKPQLRLNVDDNEFFSKFILSSPDSPDRQVIPTKESHEKIKTAAEIATRHIRDILEPYSAKESLKTSRLIEWIKFIRYGAQVILLRVPAHLNAFLMFETLNDRGLKASQADLLKNHLLSYAGGRMREAQQKWAQMSGILESLSKGDITVTFLHHLLITKYGPTKEREVFGKVQQYINSQNRSLEFLEELADAANDYAALFNSDHRKWNEYGVSTRKNISTINRDLRVDQIRPLMFSVSRHFPVQEGKLAFRLFVFWSVRILVIGKRGGFFDRNYALLAQKITNGTIKTTEELSTAMISGDIIPNDAIFEANFAEIRISHDYLARYYLRALELKRKGEPEPEFVPSDEEHAINLEHILPENIGSVWTSIDSDTARAFYKKLGNMVILQAKMNSVIGNSDFDVKKAEFKKSAFLLTSEVANYSKWGIDEINDRQKKLAKLAVETWPLKITHINKKAK
jgi:uncharacterized protein with ParB-like and HNH nuclease domain